MALKMIVATTTDGIIGNRNSLPWYCPEDLKLFKEKTMGSTVIMGRKTYESLPPSKRPLPGRKNVVVSDTLHLGEVGPDVVLWDHYDLTSFLFGYESPHPEIDMTKDVWVIGGRMLYRSMLKHVSEIHHVEIISTVPYSKITGDVAFPELLDELRGYFKKGRSVLHSVNAKPVNLNQNDTKRVNLFRETVYHRDQFHVE